MIVDIGIDLNDRNLPVSRGKLKSVEPRRCENVCNGPIPVTSTAVSQALIIVVFWNAPAVISVRRRKIDGIAVQAAVERQLSIGSIAEAIRQGTDAAAPAATTAARPRQGARECLSPAAGGGS